MPYQRVRIVSHRADDLKTVVSFSRRTVTPGVSPLCPVRGTVYLSTPSRTRPTTSPSSPRQHISIVSRRMIGDSCRGSNAIIIPSRFCDRIATRFVQLLRNFYFAIEKRLRREKPMRVNALRFAILRGWFLRCLSFRDYDDRLLGNRNCDNAGIIGQPRGPLPTYHVAITRSVSCVNRGIILQLTKDNQL